MDKLQDIESTTSEVLTLKGTMEVNKDYKVTQRIKTMVYVALVNWILSFC